MNDSQAIEAILGEKGLSRVAVQLEKLKRPSIRLRATLADEDTLPLGQSKLGGYPDLPTCIAWPVATLPIPDFVAPGAAKSWSGTILPADGRIALPFIAQIRMEDVRAYDREGVLPSSGILYFFYNPIDYSFVPYGTVASWRVVYYPGDLTQLRRAAAPLRIPAEVTYKSCALTFSSELTLPHVETCYIGEPDADEGRVLLTPDEWETYAELHYNWRANDRIHQMLGYSDDVQPYAMEGKYTAVRRDFWPDFPAWDALSLAERQQELEQGRLLLQVDQEENGMRFGRGGRLYFFIREADLAALDFGRVWAVEQ